jgi:hypothetical protein
LFGFPDADIFKKAPARQVYVELMKNVEGLATAIACGGRGFSISCSSTLSERAPMAPRLR